MEINSYTPYIPSNNNSSLTQSKLEKAYTEKDDKELIIKLAEKTGYDYAYLSRYFKATFRMGLNQYLTTVRLKNAMLLMNQKNPRRNLTYCALESGFHSLRTFHRAFLNEFGMSPKEYLKSLPPEEIISI